MPKVNIDLGQKYHSPCACKDAEMEEKEVYYPTLHVTSEDELELPREGEMVIRFRKVASEMSEDKEGKKRYSCTIEVQKIVGLYPEKDELKREPKTSDVLDEIAETVIAARNKGKSSY